MKKLLALAFVLAWWSLMAVLAGPAHAQGARVVANCGTLPQVYTAGSLRDTTQDINGLNCTSASVSASIAAFAPGGNFANLTATNVSADVALPTGANVVAQNTGTTAVSCNLTVGAGTATANQNIIQPSSWMVFTVGSNTHISCIDQTGSASNVVVFSGGSGLPAGAGGGGGSGGGGAVTMASGAVASGAYASGSIASGAFASGSVSSGAFASGSIASGAYAAGSIGSGAIATGAYASGSIASGAAVDGWDLTQGAKADAACGTDNGTCSQLALIKRMNQNLTTLNTTASSAIPAGTNTIGAVNSPYVQYETVAASQTGQTLGPTGGTGDYLSFCMVYPQTTTPGVVTVFDNTSTATNNVISFPGGASSVSNLVPFAIPVGAISVNGPWKVTTGANVIVSCYGKFT